MKRLNGKSDWPAAEAAIFDVLLAWHRTVNLEGVQEVYADVKRLQKGYVLGRNVLRPNRCIALP